MSHNVRHIAILSGELRISGAELMLLRRGYADQFPERCFVRDLAATYDRFEGDEKPESLVVRRFSWSGEASGFYWEFLIEKVIPCLRGKADLVVTWEGGDLDGMRIEGGKVIECDVVQTLQPRKDGSS